VRQLRSEAEVVELPAAKPILYPKVLQEQEQGQGQGPEKKKEVQGRRMNTKSYHGIR